MGLDITYYDKITPPAPEVQAQLDALADDRDALHDLADALWCHIPDDAGRPERAEGIEVGKPHVDNAAGGFPCGPYSRYNAWRATLARMVGIDSIERWWKAPDARPFAELLDFSDCEGIIGPVVSAKLARDFAEQQQAAEQFAAELDKGLEPWQRAEITGEYFLEKYALWRQAFEAAAKGGYVHFH